MRGLARLFVPPSVSLSRFIFERRKSLLLRLERLQMTNNNNNKNDDNVFLLSEVIFRDIQSENVLLDLKSGRTWIVDFGFSRPNEPRRPGIREPVGVWSFWNPSLLSSESECAATFCYSRKSVIRFLVYRVFPYCQAGGISRTIAIVTPWDVSFTSCSRAENVFLPVLAKKR